MALCNTVHYSYGKYMKDKSQTLQIMAKHAEQSRTFTLKANEVQQVRYETT